MTVLEPRKSDATRISDAEPCRFIRFCPHCGSREFKTRSTKEFLCSACGFNFFTNSASAVAAIICDQDGRLLLTRRVHNPGKGTWDLPGGFVDPGEGAEEALLRELREELQVEITECQYFCSFPNEYIFSNYKVYTTDIVFICRIKKEPQTAYDDIDDFRWFELSEINTEQIEAKSIKKAIQLYLQKHFRPRC